MRNFTCCFFSPPPSGIRGVPRFTVGSAGGWGEHFDMGVGWSWMIVLRFGFKLYICIGIGSHYSSKGCGALALSWWLN